MVSLYIVATPIGNLEDITLRALRILKEVDLILCEDTRVTKKLLTHYDIKTPTDSYHAKSRFPKTEKILDWLREGKNLALVTDSGTPAISDPGSHLVSLVEKELGDTVSIVPIPGPSAVTTALSVAGLPVSEFLFLGFLPHKKGRETIFKEIQSSKRTVIFYESPHRLLKTLTSLRKLLDVGRPVIVGKELTKIYEEIVRGKSTEALEYFTKHPEKIKGEFVIIVDGSRR